jgi:hypothetical protein
VKPIDRGEVLGLAEYEAIRERFRARVIAEKKTRRVSVGPHASVVFENRDTVLLQIQEMLRTERITRPSAVQHEVDTYNELLPGKDELSFSLMIEIVDKVERDQFLVAAAGLESHVWLCVGGEKLPARSLRRDGEQQGRTTAVHYMKVALPPAIVETLRAYGEGDTTLKQLTVTIDHPAYSESAVLPYETVMSLGEDLEA